jgi:hypothetical protein
MPKSNKARDSIPENFNTLEEFWEFWDNHSLADYDDLLHEVPYRVNLVRRTRMVAVEPNLLDGLATYAQSRGVSCETLINLWLREKLMATTMQAESQANHGI